MKEGKKEGLQLLPGGGGEGVRDREGEWERRLSFGNRPERPLRFKRSPALVYWLGAPLLACLLDAFLIGACAEKGGTAAF